MSDAYLAARQARETMETEKVDVLPEQIERSTSTRTKPSRTTVVLDGAASFLHAGLARAIRWWFAAVQWLEALLPGWERAQRVVDSTPFTLLLVSAILANTCVMAAEFYGDAASDSYLQAIDNSNEVFTWVFVGEMAIRLIAYGPVRYCRDPMNLFDAAVVLTSLVAVNVSALRVLRLGRLFKLARSFESLRHILRTMVTALSQSADLGFLLVLAIFMFGLLGMQVFAGAMGECDPPPPSSAAALVFANGSAVPKTRSSCLDAGGEWHANPESFDDLGSALMTVLVVFIGETGTTCGKRRTRNMAG